jgi:ZIP family zinc transporter
MKKAGRAMAYLLGVWGGIARAAWRRPGHGRRYLIPEAFEEAHDYTGLVTVCGLLAAFALEKLAA